MLPALREQEIFQEWHLCYLLCYQILPLLNCKTSVFNRIKRVVIFHNPKPYSVTEITWGIGHSLKKGTISLLRLTLHMLKLSFVTLYKLLDGQSHSMRGYYTFCYWQIVNEPISYQFILLNFSQDARKLSWVCSLAVIVLD